MNNALIEISNWLNSERNYDDGVFLFSRYGKSEQLKRIFPGRKDRYADKLAYELGKVIGVGCREIASGVVPDVGEPCLEQTPESGLCPAAAGGVYPAVVQRVIAEMSRLYKERGMLKAQLNGVADENTAEHIERRRVLIGQIEALSAGLDVLFAAKKAYLTEGILPDGEVLFGEPEDRRGADAAEKTVKSGEELLKLRNNLRSSITRTGNMLEYQSQKREAEPDPMPPCPKREELEQRMKEKEKLLEETEEELKRVAGAGQD